MSETLAIKKDVPAHARVVIIGGGIAGCSVAYHLAKLGWKDIVLLERKQLTSGTTWHAAGLIAQLRATKNMTRLAKYSQELYGNLEEETGVATGFRRNGSITVALTDETLRILPLPWPRAHVSSVRKLLRVSKSLIFIKKTGASRAFLGKGTAKMSRAQ